MFSETLAWKLVVLVIRYVPRFAARLLTRRSPRETVSRWRRRGEAIRNLILAEPDAQTSWNLARRAVLFMSPLLLGYLSLPAAAAVTGPAVP